MTHTPEQLTDEQIVALRDQHLPSQSEPFDCIAFARAILRAQADALASPPSAEPAAPTCPACGTHEVSLQQTCHNSACSVYAQDVTTHEGWKVAAHPPAAPQQQPEAAPTAIEAHIDDPLIPAWVNVRALRQALDDPRHTPAVYFERQAIDDVKMFVPANQPWPAIKDAPAEPGELPPLPVQEHWESENAWAKRYARLALATSPLPAERVERVMEAVGRLKVNAGLDGAAEVITSRGTEAAIAAVRAILEGRQP